MISNGLSIRRVVRYIFSAFQPPFNVKIQIICADDELDEGAASLPGPLADTNQNSFNVRNKTDAMFVVVYIIYYILI